MQIMSSWWFLLLKKHARVTANVACRGVSKGFSAALGPKEVTPVVLSKDLPHGFKSNEQVKGLILLVKMMQNVQWVFLEPFRSYSISNEHFLLVMSRIRRGIHLPSINCSQYISLILLEALCAEENRFFERINLAEMK